MNSHRLSLVEALRASVARAPAKTAIAFAEPDVPPVTYAALGRILDGERADPAVPPPLAAMLRAIASGECARFDAPAALPVCQRTPALGEDSVIARVPDGAGGEVALTHRSLTLRIANAAVMHPALTRDTVSAVPLPLGSPAGLVAWFAPLWLGATLVPFDAGATVPMVAMVPMVRMARAIAAGRVDQAWLGPAALATLAALAAPAAPAVPAAQATDASHATLGTLAAELAAPSDRFRLAICCEPPTDTVAARLRDWLGEERVTAERSEPAAGALLRYPRLARNAEVALGVGADHRPTRLTVADGIRANATHRPERIAIVMGEEALSYRMLAERIDRVSAGALHDLGLRPGDRALVVLPNCLPYLEIVCGLASAGVPAACAPPMAIAPELRFIAEDCAARVLFCHTSNEAVVREAVAGLVERVIVVGGDYEEWLARANPPGGALTLPPIDEDAIFSIPYTSGATGKPKGILLSHRSRILTAYAAACEYRALGPDTRMLVSTPVFHGAGFLNLLAPCWFGGQAVILPRFTIEGLLDTIAQHRINAAHMVPAHFAALFALSAAERGRYDLRSLRSVVSGTAPLAQSMKERIIELLGPGVLHERYGSTEASIVTNLRPEDQLRKQACVGTPFATVALEIRGPDGRVLAAGATGELWSRSPLMFSGYLNRPQAEATALREGWVSAGDLARRDDEGYVYLVDRKNDMIISGGENVYPREIEEVLARHPAILEVAVIGMPHEYWGEAVTAVVRVRDGMHCDAADLERFCTRELARWKIPKRFAFRAVLPRNSMGKILRRELRDELARGER